MALYVTLETQNNRPNIVKFFDDSIHSTFVLDLNVFPWVQLLQNVSAGTITLRNQDVTYIIVAANVVQIASNTYSNPSVVTVWQDLINLVFQNRVILSEEEILALISGGTAGVSSFNGRQGQVTLLSSDVTTALGYTPFAQPTGTNLQYITGTGALQTFPTSLSQFTNTPGYITASSHDTLTNKQGLISMWTNDVGYLTASTFPGWQQGGNSFTALGVLGTIDNYALEIISASNSALLLDGTTFNATFWSGANGYVNVNGTLYAKAGGSPAYGIITAADSAGRSALFGDSTMTTTGFAHPGLQINVFSSRAAIQAFSNVQSVIEMPLTLNETGGNVLIGTAVDSGNKLEVNGNAHVVGALAVSGTTYLEGVLNYVNTLLADFNNASAQINFPGDGSIGISTGTSSAARALTVSTSGDVLIGTTTDNGFKLDVNGKVIIESVGGPQLFFQTQFGGSSYLTMGYESGYNYYIRTNNGGQGSINMDFSSLNGWSWVLDGGNNLIQTFSGVSVITSALNKTLWFGDTGGSNTTPGNNTNTVLVSRAMDGQYYNYTTNPALTVWNGSYAQSAGNVYGPKAYWYRNGYIGIGTSNAVPSTASALRAALTINQGTQTAYRNTAQTTQSQVITTGSSTLVSFTPDNGNAVPTFGLVVGSVITANSETRTIVEVDTDHVTVDSAVDWSAGYTFTYRNPYIDIADGATPFFSISPAGNVLIGTRTDAGVPLLIDNSLMLGDINNNTTLSANSLGDFYVAPITSNLGVVVGQLEFIASGNNPTLNIHRVRSSGPMFLNFIDSTINVFSIAANDGIGFVSYTAESGLYQSWFNGASEVMRLSTGNNLLIRTTTDNTAALQVNGWLYSSSGLSVGSSSWSSGTPLNGLTISGVAPAVYYVGSGAGFSHSFRTNSSTSIGERLRITDSNVMLLNSHVLIGTTSDNGNLLQVNGSASIAGAIATGSALMDSTTGIATNNIRRLTDTTMFVWPSGNTLIGMTFQYQSNVAIGATSGNYVFTQFIPTFNPTSGTATHATIEISPVITQTGGATGTSRGLYIIPSLTNAADWRAIEVVTGNSYFGTTSGNLIIGSTTDNGARAQITQSLTGSANTTALSITSTYNTTGVVSALAINVTNTASGTGSYLFNVTQDSVVRLGIFAGAGRTLFTSNGVQLETSGGTGGGISLNGSGPVGNAIIVSQGFSITQSNGISGAGVTAINLNGGGSATQPTSGTNVNTAVVGSFAPTSGTATHAQLNVAPIINQTGGANGITRAVYITPTLTAAADFRALEVSTGKSVFLGNVLIGSSTDNGDALQVAGAGYFAGDGSSVGIYLVGGNAIRTTGAGNIYVDTLSGSGGSIFIRANGNYSVASFSSGRVAIGSSSDDGVNKLQVNGSITAASYINLGGGGSGGSGFLTSTAGIAMIIAPSGTQSMHLGQNVTRSGVSISLNNPANFTAITDWYNSSNTVVARMTGTGNLLIGTTTDDGINKLQVSGSAKAKGLTLGYVAVTATYSILTTDYTIECTSGTFTVTLPTAIGVTGQLYNIKNSGTGSITLATTSSQTIDGATIATLLSLNSITVQSNGSNWIVL